jgi:transcriptional regulator with GAF, ATPase, and Fis domain
MTKLDPLPTQDTAAQAPYIDPRRLANGNVEQILVVPILIRGQMFGVMEFRAPQGENWDDRGLELARAIAQRLALSLDNLRLFEQAQLAVAREQMANQVATMLQARSDIDSLVNVAVEAFQQVLGATKASIRLGLPNEVYKADDDALAINAAPPAQLLPTSQVTE